MRLRARFAAPILAALLAAASPAALAASVSLIESVQHAASIDPTMVKQLPATESTIAFQTSHGPEKATYTGATLWSVLQKSASLNTDPRQRLHQVIIVTGSDGYTAALALAEIDPEFEGKPVLLAYKRDGKPLDQLRLVVPGDKFGGRSVQNVVRIEIR